MGIIMKKILILHRSDLYNLTSDLPIEKLSVEAFRITGQEFEEAEFIAFEEGGLLKILKNLHGACVTMPWTSFLMAIDLITKQEAVKARFAPDIGEQYFTPDFHFAIPPKPEPKFIIGDDPASKDQSKPVAVLYDPLQPVNPKAAVAIYRSLNQSGTEFHEEAMKTAKYYGGNMLPDYDDLINSAVASAIENSDTYNFAFPENLTEAILYFNEYVPDVIFEKPEFWYAPVFPTMHPDKYKTIAKECGFWCEDTPLYKSLKHNFKCDHEACMINIIIKAVYRFKKFNLSKNS
jgi:hypothetical protein